MGLCGVRRFLWFCSYEAVTHRGPIRTLRSYGTRLCHDPSKNAGLLGKVTFQPNFRPFRRVSSSIPSRGKTLVSKLPFNLATGVLVGVWGSVLYYVWKKHRSGQHSQTLSERTGGRFKDKNVLITGAAGDIGGATALAFAQEGATLVLVDLPVRKETLEVKCKELEAKGAAGAFFKTTDVSKAEDVQQMVQFAVEKMGRIDCFFNNAGIQGELRPLHRQDDNAFQKLMSVNIYGVFLGMKYVSKVMVDSHQGGVIVNTSSLAGMLGPPNMAAYAASKYAVVGMTKTAAKDLAPYGIRVCSIAPGIVEGKMWHTQIKGQAECQKQLTGDTSEVSEEGLKQTEKRMIEGTPLKRLGKLSEVASVVLFLCSDDASYLTGTVVPIDGGRLP